MQDLQFDEWLWETECMAVFVPESSTLWEGSGPRCNSACGLTAVFKPVCGSVCGTSVAVPEFACGIFDR